MHFIGRAFGGRVPFAFFCYGVNENGTVWMIVAHVGQDGDELFQIVAVNGADVIKPHFFEHRSAAKSRAGSFFRAFGRILDRAGACSRLFWLLHARQDMVSRRQVC